MLLIEGIRNGSKENSRSEVLGKVGQNYVLLHRRQVLRCAPGQVRPATTEEKTVLGSPQAEMLGIKDLIEQGNIRSQQFLDLLPQSYPPEEPGLQPSQPSAVLNESDDQRQSEHQRLAEIHRLQHLR